MAVVGAPSPTWQHGAVTMMVNGVPSTPPLEAVTVAVPPPTALRVAVAPEACTLTTWPLELAHTMGWPTMVTPLASIAVALTCSVSPCFRRNVVAPLGVVTETEFTGNWIVGVPPPAYWMFAPWNDWLWIPPGSTTRFPVGNPSGPASPPFAT